MQNNNEKSWKLEVLEVKHRDICKIVLDQPS